MSHKEGTYLGGIRTVEDLRVRCYVDPDTACWHWRLAIVQGHPKVHFVAPDTCKRTTQRGRRAALYLQRGRDLPDGHFAFARLQCKSLDCVNPAHCVSGDRAAHGEYLRQSGRIKGLPSKCAGSRKSWEKRRKITPEIAQTIRTSEESTYALAKRLGLSQFAVWSCRVGKSHRATVANASAFTWGGSAA